MLQNCKHLMKKKLIVLVILIVKLSVTTAQSNDVTFLIDTTITIMKQNVYDGGVINWTELKRQALLQAANITSPYQLGPVMRYLYKSINDFHGAFFYKDSTFQWQHNKLVISDSISNEWKKGVESKTMLLDGEIGYLRIPSMPVADKKDFNVKAQKLNDSLCILLNKHVKGIILDLRLNGGGAMHPMILGLEQLLTPGRVGSFQTKIKEAWSIKENGFYVDTALISKINPTCNINAQKIPVVMLISPITGSAAECLIISFKGRKKTILLGSKTAGYVTVNTGIPINNEAFINLSVGFSMDRNGKVYKDAIEPDIPLITTDKFNDIQNDEKVRAATKWLKQNR